MLQITKLIFLLLFFSISTLIFAQTTVDSTKSVEQVYVFVEVMPKFPGKEGAFQKFIADNLKYPADAKSQGIEGTVYAQFTINENGELTNINIIEGRGLSPSCDQAVIDVLKKSPKWSPRMHNGKPVAVKMAQKVTFTLRSAK